MTTGTSGVIFFSLHGSYLWGKGERKLMHGRADCVWDRNACNDQGHSQELSFEIILGA